MSGAGEQSGGQESWTQAAVLDAIDQATKVGTSEHSSLLDACVDHPEWWNNVPTRYDIVARLRRKVEGEEVE
jgi:hypothetical protein